MSEIKVSAKEKEFKVTHLSKQIDPDMSPPPYDEAIEKLEAALSRAKQARALNQPFMVAVAYSHEVAEDDVYMGSSKYYCGVSVGSVCDLGASLHITRLVAPDDEANARKLTDLSDEEADQ